LTKELTILQINDAHSYLELHNEVFYGPQGVNIRKAGGYSRIQTLVDNLRKEREGRVLFLDNGDTFHGTYEAVESKGASMIPVLNHLGLDAMTFHWDIAYGPKVLEELAEALFYPVLAINVYRKETGKLLFPPYVLKEINGIRVAIIGIASNIVDKTMPPSYSEGLRFTTGDKELPGYIKEVKDHGAELVVVLSHLGFPQDYKMASEISGIDICVSGHTHNRLKEPVKVNNTYIIQSGSQGSFIGLLDLTLDEEGITALHHELLEVREDIPENTEMKKIVDGIMDPFREILDKKVGETKADLHRGNSLESSMDNFILKSLLHATNADMAFSNGWRYGAPVRKGDIKLRDLYNMIPVNPPVSLVELTGKEIFEMIEENLESTYSKDPYKQMGGYVKRALGIRTFIKLENPMGKRIQKIFAANEELDLKRTYQVTFVTEQGVPRKYGKNRRNLEMKAIDALQAYLETEPFDMAAQETFTIV